MYPPQGAAAGVAVKVLAEGTITSTDTEQDIINETAPKAERIYGWIVINNMDAGDRIVIRTRLNNIIHAQEEYADVPINGIVYVVERMVGAGDNYRVTIQRTAGTDREYEYKFFYEK